MKILHLIDHLSPGGAQTVVKGIFDNNTKKWFLFSLRHKQQEVKIEDKNVFISTSSHKFSLRPFIEIKQVIEKEKIKVLHCHLIRAQITGWLIKKIWFPNIKLIFHEHGEIFTNHFLSFWLLKLAAKNVDGYIAVSRAAQTKLVKKIGINIKKIEIIPNFVDLSHLHISADKNNRSTKKEIFTIGFAGRLSAVKGCDYLIKSLQFLKYPYKVLIAGEGLEKNNLISLTNQYNLQDKVIFLGYQQNMGIFYSSIDVLVVPSLHESFGISVIEAQAMKVPVIASNVEALNELITDGTNGLLFKEKNYQDLADKITLLKQNPIIAKRIIINAFSEVKKYSYNIFINKLNNFYEKFQQD